MAPRPFTAGELRAYREALAGGEIHVLALLDGEAAGVGFVAVEPGSDLTALPEPGLPPAGVEIVVWADRPELARGIAWAKANGFERLETANETRNALIQRLNERLGYRPFSERVLLRGPLAGHT